MTYETLLQIKIIATQNLFVGFLGNTTTLYYEKFLFAFKYTNKNIVLKGYS